MNKTTRLLIALLLIICGILAEADRPNCNEFSQSDRAYWSATDFEIYANCK